MLWKLGVWNECPVRARDARYLARGVPASGLSRVVRRGVHSPDGGIPFVPLLCGLLFRFREDMISDGATFTVELDIGQGRLGLAEEEPRLVEPLL